MNATPKRKEPEVPMISANEARRITDSTKFSNSGYAALINSTIREVAGNGKAEAPMLVPVNVAEQAVQFLEHHGFRVKSEMTMTGMVITAAW